MTEKKKAAETANENDTTKIQKSLLDDLKNEMEEVKKDAERVPDSVGMLEVKQANTLMTEEATKPNPEPLWKSLWYEGEVCCLYADSNVGKSIYAVQIAESIAQRQRVLYFDFELSAKQFQLRYTDDQDNLYRFNDNLYRISIDPEHYNCEDFEDRLIGDIELAAIETNAKVLILDNLTWICNNSEKGSDAGEFMMKLMILKKKFGFSILVIAHTPKRNLQNMITTNDLAGSKKLYNFFDSAFSIGQSAKDDDLRYIKQMKVRHGEFEFGSSNVIVCTIEKNGPFLGFTAIGYSTEKEHLKEMSDDEKSARECEIMELDSNGWSCRAIADKLGVGKSTVSRILNKHKS